MFREIVESVAANLNRHQFGEPLREMAQEFRRWLNDSFEPSSPAKGPTTKQTDPSRSQQGEWSMADFQSELHRHALQGRQFATLPLSINLSGLGRVMTRLSEQAQDGNEYGRIALTRLLDGRIEMGETCSGRDQVAISYRASRFNIPTIMIHTHPPISGNSLSPCHFSPQDFVSFMETPELRASIVIAPRASLMMIKTDKTPSLSQLPESYFSRTFDQVTNDFRVPFESKQARATQTICKMLNIGLFIRKQEADNFVFNQISLKSHS